MAKNYVVKPVYFYVYNQLFVEKDILVFWNFLTKLHKVWESYEEKLHWPYRSIVQKTKFSIKGFFCKYNQIYGELQIRSHLLRKSLMESFIFLCNKKVYYGEKCENAMTVWRLLSVLVLKNSLYAQIIILIISRLYSIQLKLCW